MAEQHLDDPNVSAGLEQVRGKTVPQRVDGDRLAQLCLTRRLTTGLLQRRGTHRLLWIVTGEQPSRRPRQSPVGAQDLQQLRRQHDVAIFATLALRDTDQHTTAIDGSWP